MDDVVRQVLETEHKLRLIRRIGRGGFAEVWQAQTAEEVPCAVKVSLDPLDNQNPAIQKELENLQLLKALVGHPHVVTLMDVWLVAGYLVTRWEFSSEGSLEDRLKQYQAHGQQGIPVEQLLRYMYDAAQGIDFLNDQGIVHRNIKPQNLLLFFNRVKVGDLGLAKLVGASTGSHTGAGTWGYLPPEAYEGQLSPTVDLYSLAATYVKLRTGQEPFGASPPEILKRQEAGQPILEGISRAERQAILQALAPKPQSRPQQGARAWVRMLYKAMHSPKSPKPTPLPKHSGSQAGAQELGWVETAEQGAEGASAVPMASAQAPILAELVPEPVPLPAQANPQVVGQQELVEAQLVSEPPPPPPGHPPSPFISPRPIREMLPPVSQSPHGSPPANPGMLSWPEAPFNEASHGSPPIWRRIGEKPLPWNAVVCAAAAFALLGGIGVAGFAGAAGGASRSAAGRLFWRLGRLENWRCAPREKRP